MAIYGDMLLYFSEQKQSLIVYEQTPKINGGWNKVPDSEMLVVGIFQNTKPTQIKDGNGNLVVTSGFEFWSSESNLNNYFTQIKNKVYRLISVQDWETEGGFYRYSLDKVVGNNGSESDDATWNLGANSFG
jgi:hypothetical protein